MIIKFLLNFINLKFLLGYIQKEVFPQPLTIEEENQLINDLFIKDKHEIARKKLILHNLRLVGHIAKKYESKDEDYDDLISIGTIGLIKAIDSYSTSKNVRLATYASRCIENEILMALRSNKKHSKNILFSESISQDKEGEDILLEDLLKSNQENSNDIYDKNDSIKLLKKYIEVLDDKEYQIIALRYGFDNNAEHTQKEIGKMFNISRSYVSRIEKRALIKLLQEFKKNQINHLNQ